MFIIKNAWKSIIRAKGRNILVGVIIVTIAVASCISLSIRNAADEAKAQGLNNVAVTASITVDQEKMRANAQASGTSGKMMMKSPETQLSLDDYQKYAKFSEVSSFYYSSQLSLNKTSDDFTPYSTSESTDSSSSDQRGGKDMMRGMQADFSLTGYSSAEAMTQFYKDQTSKIAEGGLFDFETTDKDAEPEVIINKTLATQNGVKVGDSFSLANPIKDTETYQFKVVGIYDNITTEENQVGDMMGSSAMNSENAIYLNSSDLAKIVETSNTDPTSSTDAMGRERTSALENRINATYTFADKSTYEQFESDVKAAGLSDDYKVYSPDVSNYEQSLVPLQNLSNFAQTLLLIILLVGAIVLVVLTFFNIRERKYEVGVYTAIGIKKPKVALQFAVELLIVTLFAVIIGAGIGGVASVPTSNQLLAGQVASVQAEKTSQTTSLGGKEVDFAKGGHGGGGGMFEQMTQNQNVDYLSQINASVNLNVLLQLIGIGVLLALLASIISVSFVMRYEPLQILADR